MIVDLHNHTPLCNHAQGEPKEYIQKAIEMGINLFGFSEHAPMNFDEKYRMKFEEIIVYENTINQLKNEYKNDIEILLGYEVDFLVGLIDDRVMSRKVDFFIGSVHFLGTWGFDNPEFIGKYEGKNIDDIWKSYFEAITNLAKSGLFDIVGHLDLLKIFKFLPTKDIRILAKEALNNIKKANMTIEINSAGYRKPIKEQYPSSVLLEMAYELDIPITFSSDAHQIEHIGFEREKTYQIAKNAGYKKCAIFQNRDRKLVDF